MNDLETVQGLEKLETLIQDGIGRAENLVQQAYQVDEVRQLLREMQENRASLQVTNEQAELLSSLSLALEPKIDLAHHNCPHLGEQISNSCNPSKSLRSRYPGHLHSIFYVRSQYSALSTAVGNGLFRRFTN